MRHIVACGLWPAPIYKSFPLYLINGIIFEKKLLNIKCVSSFSTNLSEAFLILRVSERDIIKNVYYSLCKVHVILVRFWWNLNFLNRFSKNIDIPNFMKILPVGAELCPCGQTDRRDEATNHFSQFCERTYRRNKINHYCSCYCFNSVRKFVVNLTIFCAFFPCILPSSVNCAVSVYGVSSHSTVHPATAPAMLSQNVHKLKVTVLSIYLGTTFSLKTSL
jgi:hypothetical protein